MELSQKKHQHRYIDWAKNRPSSFSFSKFLCCAAYCHRRHCHHISYTLIYYNIMPVFFFSFHFNNLYNTRRICAICNKTKQNNTAWVSTSVWMCRLCKTQNVNISCFYFFFIKERWEKWEHIREAHIYISIWCTPCWQCVSCIFLAFLFWNMDIVCIVICIVLNWDQTINIYNTKINERKRIIVLLLLKISQTLKVPHPHDY